MRKIVICLTCGLLVALLTACGGGQSGNEGVYAAIAPTDGALVQQADPQRAIDAIYQSLEGGSAQRVSNDELNEVFGLAPYMVVDAVAYVSDVDVSGELRDIAIIRPAPAYEEQAREALNQYAAARAASFRTFDVLNSYSIASGAVVFNQGEHLVMLMLPDNDAARVILDQYLPG